MNTVVGKPLLSVIIMSLSRGFKDNLPFLFTNELLR